MSDPDLRTQEHIGTDDPEAQALVFAAQLRHLGRLDLPVLKKVCFCVVCGDWNPNNTCCSGSGTIFVSDDERLGRLAYCGVPWARKLLRNDEKFGWRMCRGPGCYLGCRGPEWHLPLDFGSTLGNALVDHLPFDIWLLGLPEYLVTACAQGAARLVHDKTCSLASCCVIEHDRTWCGVAETLDACRDWLRDPTAKRCAGWIRHDDLLPVFVPCVDDGPAALVARIMRCVEICGDPTAVQDAARAQAVQLLLHGEQI